MIIESGLIVAVGLVFTFFKLSWRIRLLALGKPLLLDVIVFIGLNILHMGTFSGVMVAAVGALVCSSLISLGRWAVGYIDNGRYFPGHINVHDRIK